MVGEELPPPVEERYRVPGRIATVFLAYVIYRLPGDSAKVAPRIFLGIGVIALGWALVERLTVWRRNRSSLMLMGTSLLGLGFIGLGLATL